ncbi:AAA family ATPase [Leptospira kirschneri]|uniref:AAA family ATPase n=1 Tax=Leptospira kirschneri TaxID=29507 RepID=UPI001E5437DE|nr:AAA family ATPase [Leptospira kirschneri]UML82279.1 AAA family ATPase [Leptospira kirschneri]
MLVLYLEPVSKLSIKEIENNNSACEVKRSRIIFRFCFPPDKDSPESIVSTVRSFNDPSSRLSFIFTDQWFLASSSNVRPDISSSN